jgi:DNA mismatch repair protein MutL
MSEPRVRELDTHLVSKIAAGEVIERPASVVKELVENSLDAGASRIEVVVEGGGLRRMAVIDDGHGLSREDLRLAIRRHTTSKIRSEEDLERICTLGFRGEALASIVEVSRATIVSRDEGSQEATRLEVEGGVITHERAEGRRRGTTVDVRDLFYNTPARRKFLKSEKTEFFHIMRTIKRFALAHPSVHFVLKHNGRLALESPPARDLREAIAQLYDAELAKDLLAAQAEGREVRVHGLVAPPQRARSDRTEQYVFVNTRYVRDAAVHYAISKAYEGFLKDKHPIVFLFIDIDPQMVDVNVHPKKEEVRFSNPKLVQMEVMRAITEALLTKGSIPHLKSPRPDRSRSAPRQSLRLEPPAREAPELDLKRELLERARAAERPQPPFTPPSSETGPTVRDRVLGQLHGTYILVQTPEGLELIDQHVAHERILFEKILDQLTSGRVRSQKLLIPLTLELPPDQAELLEKHLDVLDGKLGIGLERFGGRTYLVREWPESFSEELTLERVQHTLERVLQALEREDEPGLEELAKQLAADLACEAAVVKNTPLTLSEMEHLIRELRQTGNPYRCPHGRPIIVKYSIGELERAFGRR